MPNRHTKLLEGLRIRVAEGLVHFDQPTPVRLLATAALRGLIGEIFKTIDPELLAELFKPNRDGRAVPPPFTLQNLNPEAETQYAMRFRICAWDPYGKFIPVLRSAAAAAAAQSMPFGARGTRVAKFQVNPPSPPNQCPMSNPNLPAKLIIATPARIKHRGQFLDQQQLTFGHLVKAAAQRLNLISDLYGNRRQTNIDKLTASAALVREFQRELRWIAPKRLSTAKQAVVNLAGVIGHLHLGPRSAGIDQLLRIATLIHLGSSSVEGCGRILPLKPHPPPPTP